MTKFTPIVKKLPIVKRPVIEESTALQLANPPQVDAPLIARYGNSVLYGTFNSPVGPGYPQLASMIHINVEGVTAPLLIDARVWDIELVDPDPVGTDALDGGELDD